MKETVTVTLKIRTITKVALELFQTKQLGKTGNRLTNDDAIMQLIKTVDPEAVEQARELLNQREEEDE